MASIFWSSQGVIMIDYLEQGRKINSVKRPLKIDKAKILMTNGSFMKVKSIVECSPWSILQCF